MRSVSKFAVLFLVLVLVAGCASMNVQRSGIRGAADVITTVRLDKVDVDKVDDELASIRTVTEKILAYLEEASIIDLSALEDILKQQLDAKFHPFIEEGVEELRRFVKNVNIKPSNKKRGIAFCRGILKSCDLYDKTDRDDD